MTTQYIKDLQNVLARSIYVQTINLKGNKAQLRETKRNKGKQWSQK